MPQLCGGNPAPAQNTLKPSSRARNAAAALGLAGHLRWTSPPGILPHAQSSGGLQSSACPMDLSRNARIKEAVAATHPFQVKTEF